MGEAVTRHSLRPLRSEGQGLMHNSDALRAARMRSSGLHRSGERIEAGGLFALSFSKRREPAAGGNSGRRAMLSKGDDYPIHQTPEPIAFAGTDRNFYDRYFFNGYATTQGDKAFFAAAFGVYPHLNIADAAFTVVRNGVEVTLHASRHLEMERMNLVVGP